jgi:hypothetical protein
LEKNSIFWTKQIFILFFLLILAPHAFAQNWMSGYSYRKKITIDKSKVSGAASLSNFPVLIRIQDTGLKYLSSCESRLKSNKGLDISFAQLAAPMLPISFQLDHYDPANGVLACWVNIPELFATNHAGHNEIYLYYGSNSLHDPFSPAAQAVWSVNHQRVWHLNFDAEPSISRNANGSGKNLSGTPGMGANNFPVARIGQGLLLNGSTDAMYSAPDTNTTIYISAWIQLHQIGTEQTVLANDTTNGGYVIKINALGNPVFETKNAEGLKSITAAYTLSPNTWYYFVWIFSKGVKRIYIDGMYRGGGGSSGIKLGRGGALSIGRSKQNDNYFNGLIDELRIENVERNLDWLTTEYRNQYNPEGFIQVAAEEVNPGSVPVMHVFTGSGGTDEWANPANWADGELPGQNSNVIIQAGQELRLSAGAITVLNKLVLEPAALLTLAADLELNCTVNIATSAKVTLAEGARLVFKSDVWNDGEIVSDQDNCSLVLKGDYATQLFGGAGTTDVSRLEINHAAATHTTWLQSKINVSQQVELIRGTLNANGNLNLLAGAANQAAALLPILDAGNAQITGNVNVQHFIAGSFLSPSTARGWWLLASPVYQTQSNGQQLHDLSAVKASVFVTGKGGIQNGFDASPNNGATIYTHDQSLPGSLSQKYKAIPNMNATVPLGTGFYLFSRGGRDAPEAYQHQIQQAPFSNPGPYVITYSGKLFTGDLAINLFNRNTGAEGDGFNLLGNPYASAVRWGALQKNNLSPFIWVFDPKNNAYQVSDDPAYLIPSGRGFFVRVNAGQATGSVTFSESAKYTGSTVPPVQMFVQVGKGQAKNETLTRLKVRLSKDDLADDYVLVLRKDGNDEVNDADADKIGEGYLSIAGLTHTGNKLSIEERAADTSKKEVSLYVKGWTNGIYTLNLKAEFKPNEEILLSDHYLGVNKRLVMGEQSYNFSIDNTIPETYGTKRFALLYRQTKTIQTNQEPDKKIILYPNPFNEVLFIKSGSLTYKNLKVLIRDIQGRLVWTNDLPVLAVNIPVQQLCGHLQKGIYFLQLINQQNHKVLGSFKIIRN